MNTRFLYRPVLLTILVLNFIMLSIANGQTTEAYPTNWFTQMQFNKIQSLFRNTNANFSKATVNANYPGLKVLGVHHFENGHYIAVDIEIAATAKPGTVNFVFTNQGEKTNTPWSLLPRRKGRGTLFAQGINPSDLIYFLMPDRFIMPVLFSAAFDAVSEGGYSLLLKTVYKTDTKKTIPPI